MGAGLCGCAAQRADRGASIPALDGPARATRLAAAGAPLLALGCFPVWVSFHSGTWHAPFLAGGHRPSPGRRHLPFLGHGHAGSGAAAGLFRQLRTAGEDPACDCFVDVLLCVVVSLFLGAAGLDGPAQGLAIPQPLAYPAWVSSHAEFVSRPVWVETITYVGVLGGSVTITWRMFLMCGLKGGAGRGRTGQRRELEAMAADPGHVDRRWVRAPLVDSTLSFWRC